MICDLCKREFDEKKCAAECQRCGTKAGCHGVRCPYCFYERVPEPEWIQKIFSLFSPRRQGHSQDAEKVSRPCSLVALEKGRPARVTHLDTEDPRQLQKIAAIGALPGTELKVVQHFPSYVLEMGFTRFSLDRELAACIFVQRILASPGEFC